MILFPVPSILRAKGYTPNTEELVHSMSDIPSNIEQVEKIASFIKCHLPNGGIVLLSGNGTAGKTTLAHQLVQNLGPEVSGTIEFDTFYWPTDMRRQMNVDGESVTGCHPESFDRARAQEALRKLNQGEPIDLYGKPTWEGKNQITFPVTGTYAPTQWTIVNGLAAVHVGMELYKLHIFMDCCSVDEERRRRLGRDVSTRGGDERDALSIFNVRRGQYEKFVLPYRKKADLIVISHPDYSLELQFQHTAK